MLAGIYTVRAILVQKDRPEPLRVLPDLSIVEAEDLMVEEKKEAVLVMDGETFLGILTEHDCVAKLELQGRATVRTTVGEIMTPVDKVISVDPANSLENVTIIMQDHHVRHVPVLDGDKLLGLIDVWDILQATIDKQTLWAQNILGSAIGRT